MSEINRRMFVLAATATICGCAMGDAAGETASGATSVDVGDVKDFDKDGVFDKFAKTKKILIVRESGKLYAISSVCPHRSCGIKPAATAGGGLRCPCHGSSFSALGEVKKGPATESLAHLAVALDDRKHVTVDTAKTFNKDHWNDDGAVVHIA